MDKPTQGMWLSRPGGSILAPNKGLFIAKMVEPNDKARLASSALIVTAVNGCTKVNEGNPLAVASQIEAAFKALEVMTRYALVHTVEGVIYPDGSHKDWIEQSRTILAKAKEA